MLLGAVYILAFYLFLLYSPFLLDFQPKVINLQLPKFEGVYKENYILSKASHEFEGQLSGPESIVFHEGVMYTGIDGGRIVKIVNGKILPVAQTGQPCQLPYEEKICGRPLGLRMGSDGLLYVTDAYYGILSVNVTSGEVTTILPMDKVIDDRTMVFPDDMDIDQDGNIYLSDASSKWDLSLIFYLILEYENGGRILKHNIHTGKTEVLVSGVYFPNGVQLSKDKRSLLISEISNRRILKYHLEGSKKGKLEIFIDNLPGEPDNIRKSPRGYWVALASSRSSSNPMILDRFDNYPSIKKVFGRALYGLSSLLMKLADLVNHTGLKTIAYELRRGDPILDIIPHYGMIVEFDDNGQILRTYHSPDAKSTMFSHVEEYRGNLYLGSFKNNYLGRLKVE